MPESLSLLLVEDDQKQRQKLAAILEFVAQGTVIQSDCQKALDILDDNIEVVLLGGCGNPQLLNDTFNKISRKAEATPIVIILPEGGEVGVGGTKRPPKRSVATQRLLYV